MSDIAPISSNKIEGLILQRIGKANPAQPVDQETPSRGRDNVELSDHSRYLSQLRDLPAVRQDLIDSVKGQIEAGTYETDAKVDGLIDSLVEDL